MFASLKSPTARDQRTFVEWMYRKKPLDYEDTDFMYREDDWAALDQEQEYGLLDSIIEALAGCSFPRNVSAISPILMCITHETKRFFTPAAEQLRSNDRSLRLMNRHRIEILVRSTLTLATITLLLMPSFVLFLVPKDSTMKIVIVTAFAFLFSVLIQVSSKAKKHEAVMALAA